MPHVLRRRTSTEDEVHDSSFPSGRKGRWLLSVSSVVTMIYGGHLHLVGDTKICPLRGRGHRALDRTQPAYELAERVRVGGEAKIVGTIELTTRCIPDYRINEPDSVCFRSGDGCATFLLTTSFVLSTPGITQISPSGFPIISTLLQQFLLKDVALLAACVTLLLASLSQRPAAS